MDKLYQICYLYGNELDDIRMATTFEAAVRLLTKDKQILEFDVVDCIAGEYPVAVYMRDEIGDIVKRSFKTGH